MRRYLKTQNVPERLEGNGNNHKTDRWDAMKPKSFYTVKEGITRVKGQLTDWETKSNYTSDLGLIPRIHEIKHPN